MSDDAPVPPAPDAPPPERALPRGCHPLGCGAVAAAIQMLLFWWFVVRG